MVINKQSTRQRQILFVLLFLLICRIIAMYFMPLNDTTEARYGEIARIMLETGNWVTPMESYGIPFWAKPPLSTWASAFSMKLFGVNEFAVRMPSLLLSIGVLGLVWNVAKKRSGYDVAMTAVLVLAGSLFFFLNAGAVMTDPALLFCITLSLVSFWHAVVMKNKLWGYLFFVGLGLGLLAKGPIAVVLTGMPIFIWTLVHKRMRELWRNLPWFQGVFLMLLIAGPWYVMAELRTPGFLNYFIVGEHFHRFLDPGWGGDKYGFAHVAHYGMIWVYAFLGFSPWSFAGVVWLVQSYKKVPSLCQDSDGWISYLVICTLTPLVFFTFSSNIIYPYAFPSMPAVALLFAELAHRSGHRLVRENGRQFLYLASITGILFLIVTALFIFKPEWVEKSQCRVVAAYKNQASSTQSKLIYWAQKIDFSARFYSRGHVFATVNAEDLERLLSNNIDNFVVINAKYLAYLSSEHRQRLIKIKTISVLKDTYILFRSSLKERKPLGE